jgi:3-hydroxyacyl-CoA dehydrogenase/enoyl-CoA hydratase/3-hydroxybutyryl-CoA epimerase
MYKIIKQTEKDTGVVIEGAQKQIATLFVEKLDRIGKKAGKGFYEYPEGGKKFLWPGLAEHFPVKEGIVDIETAKTRLLYRQVIEAVKCMEEGIVTSPKDADIGSIFGWGFAPYSGGVISFLDFVGYATFVATADKLADTYGERFRPTDKLRAMAANGESYYSKAKELEVA